MKFPFTSQIALRVRRMIFFLGLSIFPFAMFAQGVGINAEGNNPDGSAMLDVNSADSGLLIPRVQLIAKNQSAPISGTPAISLLVYNTSTTSNDPANDVSPGFYFWSGAEWTRLTSGEAQEGGGNGGSGWSLAGNSGIDSGVDYLGTSDASDLVIRTDNLERVRVGSGGNIGIAQSNPQSTLDINGSLAVRTSTFDVNSSNLLVPVTGTSHIVLTSTGASPTTPWLFQLEDGAPGQFLVIELQSGYASLAVSDNVVLTSPYADFLFPYSTLTLKWNDIDQRWVELSRNGLLNSSATYYGNKQVFTYSGDVQTFTVPPYVSQLFVKLWGAGGGGGASTGGAGAYVSGYLSVTPGQTLQVIVGGGGVRATQPSLTEAGGFGGGGAAGSSGSTFRAGSGGGRSAIQVVPGTDVVTAGGGGGAGSYFNNSSPVGGGGGAPNGSNGGISVNANGFAGQGGTLVSGGGGGSNGTDGTASGGSQYTGGAGGTGSSYGGGGGGSGYFGGGGGGRSNAQARSCGGGGGGSSFTSNLTTVTNTPGASGSTNAPNNNDVDYVTGVARGGSTNGGPGAVVIYW